MQLGAPAASSSTNSMAQEIRNELIGSIFEGRYRVLKALGEGAMGTVFLGEHIAIGRQVAIKVLNPRLGRTNDFSARFKREAIAAARLDHPNCVPVTDSGQLADGTPYMVMELVTGPTLGELLEDEGPQLDPVRALKIARHVLRGLGHAHAAGIVHRDIKPDNVMLTKREETADFARVLDFGIAKLRDADNQESEALTQAGMAVGTPSYLSPEQALGENVDQRSDLYSVSVLLFEMLTGRPPFVAANPVGVLTKHASAPIPHLHDVAEHLSQYPQLDSIIERGLAKRRNERFDDAAEFVTAIDEALLSLGSQITPVPPSGGSEDTDNIALSETSLAETREHTARILAESRSSPRTQTRFGYAIIAALIAVAGIAAFWLSGSSDSSAASDKVLTSLVEKLKNAEPCEQRLEAVRALAALRNKGAIPELKKARRRMRGGTLGFGQRNTNRCLRKEADWTIKMLQDL